MNSEKLFASELRYRRLFESAKDGILILNAETGQIDDVNPFLIELLGYSRDQFVSKTIWDIGFFKDIVPNRENFLQLKEKKYIRYEDRPLETADGRKIDVEFVSNVYQEDRQSVIQCNIRDITKRKRAEDEIRRNESRLESLLKISQYHAGSINDFLDFALDEGIALTGSKMGYIYTFDETKKEFTLNSWSKEAMAQCTIVERQTIYQLDTTGIWGEAVRQKKPIIINNFQAPNPLKKGYPEGHAPLFNYLTIPVFADEHIVAVIGVANKETDYNDSDVRQLTLLMDSAWKIIAHKQLEKELRESEQRLQLAQESASVGIWDWNVQTGELDFTPELNKLYGLLPGTIKTYQDWRDRVHPDDIFLIETQRDEAIAKHEPFDLEFRGRHSSGEYRWISTKGGAIYGETGKTLRVLGVNIDITARKQDENALVQKAKELRKSNTELEQFNMVMVGRELRMIELKKEINQLCHEFGQPTRYPKDSERFSMGSNP